MFGRLRRASWCGLVAVVVTVMVGCSRQAPPPTGAAPPPGSPDAGRPGTVVRFTYSEKTCYLPVVIAVEKGFYAEEGLDVRPVIVTGGIESAEALIGGQADVATLGDAPTVIALARSPGIIIICNQALGERMHRLVVRDDAGIEKPRDLEGKRLAVQHGSSTHAGLIQWAAKNGVDLSQVSLVSSLSPRDFPEAMAAKQLDAIAGSQPWPGNVLRMCPDCRVLANFEGLGNYYPLPIIARTDFMQKNPAAAGAVVRGTIKAVEYIEASPAEAAEILGRRAGTGAEAEAEYMEDYDFTVEMDARLTESLAMTAQFLVDQGKIERLPDIEASIDRTAPAEALQGRARQ